MSKQTEIWKKMEKMYGGHGAFKDIESVEVIHSGSYALDDATGVWGLPRGRFIQYAGAESSGKSLMSLVAIKNWQDKSPKNWAVYIDVEFAFNSDWAHDLGIDMGRLNVIREDNAAKIFTYLCGKPNPDPKKPKIKDGLLDMIVEYEDAAKGISGSDASGLGLIVLDSVAVMQSPIESIKEVGHTNIAPLARFLADGLKRLKPLLSKSKVTFIAINQIRVDPGKSYGNPETTPGGKSLKHACDIMVHFGKTESKAKMFFNDMEERYGHIVNARIDKNRVGPAHKSFEFDLEYLKGVVNQHKELGQLGLKYGVVTKPNNMTYSYYGEEFKGKDNFFDYLKNKDLSKFLEDIKKEKDNYKQKQISGLVDEEPQQEE